MKTFFAFLAALVFASAALANEKEAAAAGQAAADFYSARVAAKIQGLPDEMQLRDLEPHLTPDLKKLFVAARVEQLKYMRANPGEKPPWIDGDLFSSSFEGQHTHQIGKAEVKGDRAEVPVALTWNDRGQIIKWSDALVLKKIEGKWLLDDIIMKADWAFKAGATLRKSITGPVE